MSRKYKFNNPEGLYFISVATVGWIDVFTRNTYKDMVVESLKYCHKEKGLMLFALLIRSKRSDFLSGNCISISKICCIFNKN